MKKKEKVDASAELDALKVKYEALQGELEECGLALAAALDRETTLHKAYNKLEDDTTILRAEHTLLKHFQRLVQFEMDHLNLYVNDEHK